jgi:hypothetical protein
MNFINYLIEFIGVEINLPLIPCLILIYFIGLLMGIKFMRNRKAFYIRGILITFNVASIMLSSMLLMRVSVYDFLGNFYCDVNKDKIKLCN